MAYIFRTLRHDMRWLFGLVYHRIIRGHVMCYKVIYVRNDLDKSRTRYAQSIGIARSIIKELRRIHGLNFWAILDNDNNIIENGQ